MKKAAIGVAVGVLVVWAVAAYSVQGATARAREAEARATALHEKTMQQDAERRKAELERLDAMPVR